MRIYDTGEAKAKRLIPPTETDNPDTPSSRSIPRQAPAFSS